VLLLRAPIILVAPVGMERAVIEHAESIRYDPRGPSGRIRSSLRPEALDDLGLGARLRAVATGSRALEARGLVPNLGFDLPGMLV